MFSNIEYEICTSVELVDVLVESIDLYFPQIVSNDRNLEHAIAEFTDPLRDDLHFLIEYPYVDKFYRNSYYHYFGSKHSAYHRDCIRILLFDGDIKIEEFLQPEHHSELARKFLGYFILRPIRDIFGRSLISPTAFEDNDFKICRQSANCSVLGVKLFVDGFPHCSQDRETITCAETTLWAVMEYFGNKYADYRPVLPSQIIKAFESQAIQRQLPAVGLTMEQISFALKQFGFGPRIYSFERYKDPTFEIADTYVESGIPVLAGLTSDAGELGHVVILIGKQWVEPKFKAEKRRNYFAFEREVFYYDCADFERKYVVQDDNLAPYRIVSLENPGEHYEDDESKAYKVDHIVVPLHPKVYLEAYVGKSLVLEILRDVSLGHNFEDDFVLRFFLTSSRSFKAHITSLSNIGSQVKQGILMASMPKFIWVAEFYDMEAFTEETKSALGFVILDATEIKTSGPDALIFAAYPDKCVSIEENVFVTLPFKLENYNYFSNLV